MPHLSPMNWIVTPIIMISTMIMLMIIMWWQITPQFPVMPPVTSSTTSSKSWRWW